MTREEEIEKAIEEEFEDHLFEDECDYIMQSSKFKKGILWADQNPKKGLWDANKVIKWLQDNADSHTWYDEFEGESGMTDNFIEDLQKAMEE
jgi:hypothetical protein